MSHCAQFKSLGQHIKKGAKKDQLRGRTQFGWDSKPPNTLIKSCKFIDFNY